MKCSYSKIDCHNCNRNDDCEVYITLLDVPVLWGEDAEAFERENSRPRTQKEIDTLKRALEIYKANPIKRKDNE